jgi:protein tyrosine/serine phosphatase
MAAENQGVSLEQVDMTNMNAFLIQDGSYIDASQDEIVQDFGSTAGYLQNGLGLSQHEISRLREALYH